jgi:hypothetical protein
MAFQLSPGINVSEIDLTTSIPSGPTSVGGFAGNFVWGPVNQIVSVSSEVGLVGTFGKPSNTNFVDWFSAANFLAYSNNLRVVRAANTTSTLNATANGNGVLIENQIDFEQNHANTSVTTYGAFAAKYAGDLGNTLRVEICPNANTFEQNITLVDIANNNVGAVLANSTSISTDSDLSGFINVGDYVSVSNANLSTAYVQVSNINATTIVVSSEVGIALATTDNQITRRWKYYTEFTDAPATSDYASTSGGSNDELHIVVVDTLGKFSNGVANSVIEKFGFVSKASDAKSFTGASNYYINVLNNNSKYIWALSHVDTNVSWGNTASSNFAETTYALKNYAKTLGGGAGGTIGNSQKIAAYSLFDNADTSDVSLVISGAADQTLASYLIDMCETRKDAIAFVSPEFADVVENSGDEVADSITFRNTLTSSSYAFMDSAWKYQYDRYNDVYRWVPLNADIAGLSARTDVQRDPWFSPAGANRGIIKNVIKLSWNPTKAQRDELYVKGINPVVSFPGEGTMLYGDKTLLSRPSAFDRINVRRLFIVLEKAIARASRSSLFEFNDSFTRAQFVSLVEPFLRDIQGRRGITDFRVVCDETNNTPEVIDRNEFVGDIYIKPARSINFIQLNFVAVRTGVAFDEIVGKFG